MQQLFVRLGLAPDDEKAVQAWARAESRDRRDAYRSVARGERAHSDVAAELSVDLARRRRTRLLPPPWLQAAFALVVILWAVVFVMGIAQGNADADTWRSGVFTVIGTAGVLALRRARRASERAERVNLERLRARHREAQQESRPME